MRSACVLPLTRGMSHTPGSARNLNFRLAYGVPKTFLWPNHAYLSQLRVRGRDIGSWGRVSNPPLHRVLSFCPLVARRDSIAKAAGLRTDNRCQFVFQVEKRTDIAPRSSGKENRYNRETFRRNPAGNQSRPEEPGQQPEASLA